MTQSADNLRLSPIARTFADLRQGEDNKTTAATRLALRRGEPGESGNSLWPGFLASAGLDGDQGSSDATAIGRPLISPLLNQRAQRAERHDTLSGLNMGKLIKPVKRETPRRRNFSGHIVLGREPHLDCRIQDLSQYGAMIVVESPSIVPDQFELAFHPADHGRACRVVWRRNRLLGVKFN